MVKLKAKRSVAKTVRKSTDHLPVAVPEVVKNRPNGAPASQRKSVIAQVASSTADAPAGDDRLGAGSIKTKSGVDLTEKVRELVTLAREQGHLTYDDINEAL